MATFYPSVGNQSDMLPSPYSGDQKLASLPDSLVHPGDMMMYLNHEMMFIPPTSNTASYGHLHTPIGDLVGSSVSGDPQMVPEMQLGILDGEQSFQGHGLSLSLGTQMQSVPSFHYQHVNSSFSTHLPTSGNKSKELRSFLSNLTGGNNSRVKAESSNPHMHFGLHQYEQADFADTILNSKYLKEAQQLLHEVVNVQKALKQFGSSKRQNVHGTTGLDVSKEADDRSSSQSMLATTTSNATESNTNGSTEVSPAERQDLQNKKAKLVSMLDEVDKRYRQYDHEMQMVVISFDSIAGSGEAKPYTALAQQTISRHFRSLRDAISGQIEVIKKRLGEQDTGIPRLRSVDRQHLGVMRHPWRPQRGLPETCVSILRAWLFEHFLHPYPNDSEKTMLARQTGLNRNQVANWFINARVRLWKPMVEEMYEEEFGDSELKLENATKVPREASDVGGEELQDTTTSIEPTARME